MGILAFITSLLLLLLTICRDKKAFMNPMTFFYLLWTIIFFLSSLNLYGMHKPSDEAYILLVIMELSFFVGTNFIKLNEKKNYTISDDYLKSNIYFNIIYALSAIIIIFNIIDLIIVLKEYSSGIPMWQIRNWSLEPYGSINPILSRRTFVEEFIRTVILAPSQLIIYATTTFYLFNGKSRDRKKALMVIAFSMLITSSLAGGGGRLGIFYFLISLFFAYIIRIKSSTKNDSNFSIKKYRKLILGILLLGVLIIVLYTSIRSGFGKIFKQVYTYFAMSPTLLSEWLPRLKTSQNTYGFLTLFGFHSYFFRTLGYFAPSLVPSIYMLSYNYILNAEVFVNIGSGSSNAFVSPIYYFYLDGGYPFVIAASILFGLLVAMFYKRFQENINMKSFILYNLVIYGLFVSFMRVQTAIPSYVISYILVFLIFMIVKKQKN